MAHRYSHGFEGVTLVRCSSAPTFLAPTRHTTLVLCITCGLHHTLKYSHGTKVSSMSFSLLRLHFCTHLSNHPFLLRDLLLKLYRYNQGTEVVTLLMISGTLLMTPALVAYLEIFEAIGVSCGVSVTHLPATMHASAPQYFQLPCMCQLLSGRVPQDL